MGSYDHHGHFRIYLNYSTDFKAQGFDKSFLRALTEINLNALKVWWIEIMGLSVSYAISILWNTKADGNTVSKQW